MTYNRQLDGLRFFAVSLVIAEHFVPKLENKITTAGYIGVELFFVISGFLITSILFRSEGTFSASYKRFIGRRTLRIFPIYYLTIAVLYFLGAKDLHESIGYFLTYTFNYAMVFKAAPFDKVGHFWSLCVEEQFYLFWPLLVLGLRNRLSLLKAVICLLLTIFGVQILFDVISGPWWNMNRFFTFPRAYALLVGALGACLFRDRQLPKAVFSNLWVEVLLFPCLVLLALYDKPIPHLLLPFLLLIFVVKTFQGGFSVPFVNWCLNLRWITYLGSISYGIYIYHLPVGGYLSDTILPAVWDRLPDDSFTFIKTLHHSKWMIYWLIFPLTFLFSIGMAHLSFRFVEKPILSLKDKLFPNQASRSVSGLEQRNEATVLVATTTEVSQAGIEN